MEEITTIGLDLAKSVFQVHAVGADGSIVLRRQLRRNQMLAFFAGLTPCLIGMEACAFVGETIPRIVSWPSSPHYRARELAKVGHEVRLMPPSYVKPYVKRGKTDAIDAEAICEAVTRPNMRVTPGACLRHDAGQDRGSAGCSDDPSGTGHGIFWCASRPSFPAHRRCAFSATPFALT